MSADPSGVARPVDPGRIAPGKGNSGVIVGQVEEHVPTMSGTEQTEYRTAFIKVYQDAGVVGLSMLTLLVLCFLMGLFCSRLIKMYQALSVAAASLDSERTKAVERLTAAVMILTSKVDTLATETSRDTSDVREELRRTSFTLDKHAETNRASMDILIRAVELGSRRISNEGSGPNGHP